MQIITVKDITAEIEWKAIKNVHLTIYPPDARVHVSAPEKMSEDAIRLFLISKLAWIKERVRQIHQQERQTEREYVSGENHYFKGIRYRLKIIYHDAAPKIEIQGTQFIVMYIRENTKTERRAEILKEWYRGELKKILLHYIAKWEQLLKVKVNKWDVKQMKTLWGSCNHTTRNILFNLELVKKPLRCIEYIVVHELLHINIRLHNEEFISRLNYHFPDWRAIKNELNEFIV
ncbi:M48 family metallopeptidase [Odoribacter sp. Z80]|uniref:M48 family metallopeptidase n=1 Tax=Odoribacter sp. Z80 TaxID=2304575 RepID=UPI00137B5CB7|nr:SprT family zinc-dependent metalloprotease [Odoribacter sp. Z80]NCE73224.1 M48 family peptidase [Odoribacter sp. Z80]